jgi:hypothetical protein
MTALSRMNHVSQSELKSTQAAVMTEQSLSTWTNVAPRRQLSVPPAYITRMRMCRHFNYNPNLLSTLKSDFMLHTYTNDKVMKWSPDSSVDIVSSHLGSNRGKGKRFFSFPLRPDRFCPAYHPMDTRDSPWKLRDRAVKLKTHLHLDPRLRIYGATSPLPYISKWLGA